MLPAVPLFPAVPRDLTGLRRRLVSLPIGLRRRILTGALHISVVAAIAVLVTVGWAAIPRGAAGSTEAVLLAAAAGWLLTVALTGALGTGDDRQRRSRLLLATLLSVTAGAIAAVAAPELAHLDVLVLLALLALVALPLLPVLRRIVDHLDPQRTILVCPAGELGEQRRDRHRRVRGFAAETLADPDFVIGAIRLDLHRSGAHCIELHPAIPERTVHQLSWALRHDHVDLLLHQSAGRVRASRARLLTTPHGPGMLLAAPRPGAFARCLKRTLDLCGAAVLLIVFSPLLLVTAFLIRREDGAPALYRQERIGLDGAPFTIFKFRTMTVDADSQLHALLRAQGAADAPLFKVASDPRLTRLGPFLRRSSIDELPQLLNVLEGTMSLVGPRPQRAPEVALYSGPDEHRLGVRPGMTGLWQVSGRSRLTWDQARELDVHYAHNWSPLLDLQILLRTVSAVLRRDGAI